MSPPSESTAEDATPSPVTAMRITIDALVEVSRSMQDIELAPIGSPVPFEAKESGSAWECGSCISLSRPGVSWNLALFGSTESCKQMARALLTMGPAEELGFDEVADALGEILNMVAGVTKRKLPVEESKSLLLGLPLFLSGTDCFRYLAKGIRCLCQKISGPTLSLEVIIVWKEGG